MSVFKALVFFNKSFPSAVGMIDSKLKLLWVLKDLNDINI